jgi:hypothetical protein
MIVKYGFMIHHLIQPPFRQRLPQWTPDSRWPSNHLPFPVMISGTLGWSKNLMNYICQWLYAGWWFQPLWKHISQWEGLSHILWKNKKCLKPPTRYVYTSIYTYIKPYLINKPSPSGGYEIENTSNNQIIININ